MCRSTHPRAAVALRLLRPFGLLLALFSSVATASPQSSTTFAIVGDFGQPGNPERDVADLIHSWNPSFVATTGDNNYFAAGQWDAAIGQYYSRYIYNYQGEYGSGSPMRRFFPAPGNHDYDAGIDGYLDYFDLPGNERYYSTRQGPVELFVLNSNSQEPDGRSATSVQGRWLENALASSTALWKLVILHHPAYASGGTSTTMRWPFREWGADAIIQGHAHNYERLDVDGLPVFVNGLGGASIHGFGSVSSDSLARYDDDYGAMKVTVASDSVRFQFIDRTGTMIDDYSLYALAGDLDFDGRITAVDYFRIDSGRSRGLAGYAFGDINHDDRINADDYVLIDRAFLRQGATGAMPATVAALPEPSAALTLIAAMALCRRTAGRGL